MSKLPPFVIAIDSREQRPYSFPHPSVTTTLPTGDYSIIGLEHLVAIERKSKQDAFGTIGKGRARFTRELERMAEMERATIVIECTMAQFLKPPPYTRMHPRAALNSLIAWWIKYGVSYQFPGNRLFAQTLTLRILEKFWKRWVRTHPKE